MEKRNRRLDVLAPHGRLDLGLVLTHACNLACSYCYTGEKKRVRMTHDTARRAMNLGFDALLGAKDPELQLTFFGGEPLLEAELLLTLATEARARAKEASVRLLLQTTTNGTLLDDALLARLREAGVFLALSIDGTRAAHEVNRPLAGGGSSYASTVAALDRLLDSKKAFDVISVVDPANVRELATGVRELSDRGVEALTLNMNWGSPGWDEEALGVFERQLEEVAAIFIAWLRRGRWVRIEPLTGAIHALSDGAPVATSCNAGTRRIAVGPSGRLYPCARSVGEDTGAGALGHLDFGFSLNAGPSKGACHCASAEEGDAARTGPTKLRHDAILEALARRVVALLRSEYALVSVVEADDIEGEDHGHAIPY